MKVFDWNGRCETLAGIAGQVRPHRQDAGQEPVSLRRVIAGAYVFEAPRRLTARTAESEHPGVEINHYSLLLNSYHVYEYSLKIRCLVVIFPGFVVKPCCFVVISPSFVVKTASFIIKT